MDGNAVVNNAGAPDMVPQRVSDWFASRGWQPHAHQLAMLDAARNGQSVLLVAPTGGGKTLAGFLPTLAEFATAPKRKTARKGFHTLYISPLKALTVDIARNLQAPIAEMKLEIECGVRTGDTSQSRRQRQRLMPPDILLTTPESLALMLSYIEAPKLFGTVKTVVIDELHALADSKRGQLLALCLARIAKLAPNVRFVGLSATVADPPELADWIAFGRAEKVRLIHGRPGAEPQMAILVPEARLPWGGHMAIYAMADVYNAIRAHRTTLVFVNTRAQAELAFQALWKLNDENLPIGLHHGSLAIEQRRKVEAAMAKGSLRAVVATSSLDLGIDWGDIDLVVQVGAPKGASRLLQRIGRANHRLDDPSRALLVPANRFEVLECQAAIDASMAGELDGYPARPPCLDVLAQHIIGMACSQPIEPDALFAEIVTAQPFRDLPRQDFDDTFRFCVDGGYALRSYERYHRLVGTYDGESTSLYRIANPRVAQQYRMNIGTIVESPMLKVKLRRGPYLGEIEEWFVQGLVEGDTFIFSGRHLRFEGIRAMAVECSIAKSGNPSVPAYAGGRLPLTTGLADRVRAMLADVDQQSRLPTDVQEWLRLQRWRSVMPGKTGVLVEIFPRGGKQFLVAYCFEGRNAH
ncbi:MAG: ligase-associated DNA damage response DEXH box helicase, partial [Rhodospirillales bacterium]